MNNISYSNILSFIKLNISSWCGIFHGSFFTNAFFILFGTLGNVKRWRKNQTSVQLIGLVCFGLFLFTIWLWHRLPRSIQHTSRRNVECCLHIHNFWISYRLPLTFFVSLSASSFALRHDKLEISIMQWQGKRRQVNSYDIY